MKKAIYILFVCLFVSTGLAYTYEVYTYGDNKTLYDGESILVDLEGGMDGLTLWEDSTATIQRTSILDQGTGGIWTIKLLNSSSVYVTGGQINMLDISNDATAVLKGGLIRNIWSSQTVPAPHIKLYYSGNIPIVEDIGGLDFLVGQWGNGDPFSIYLHDTGYDAYGNFEFILVPEPITLALLAFGGLMLRSKKR